MRMVLCLLSSKYINIQMTGEGAGVGSFGGGRAGRQGSNWTFVSLSTNDDAMANNTHLNN